MAYMQSNLVHDASSAVSQLDLACPLGLVTFISHPHRQEEHISIFILYPFTIFPTANIYIYINIRVHGVKDRLSETNRRGKNCALQFFSQRTFVREIRGIGSAPHVLKQKQGWRASLRNSVRRQSTRPGRASYLPEPEWLRVLRTLAIISARIAHYHHHPASHFLIQFPAAASPPSTRHQPNQMKWRKTGQKATWNCTRSAKKILSNCRIQRVQSFDIEPMLNIFVTRAIRFMSNSS